MKSLHNIDKSGFHHGEYVGYAMGEVWHIKKQYSIYGKWVALPRDIKMNNVYSTTLDEMSNKLSSLTAANNISVFNEVMP